MCRVSLRALAQESAGVESDGKRFALVQALTKFGQRRTLRDLSEFAEQIVGERHARHRGPGFQAAMKSIRDISNLDHPRHAMNVFACDAHVNATARQDKGESIDY